MSSLLHDETPTANSPMSRAVPALKNFLIKFRLLGYLVKCRWPEGLGHIVCECKVSSRCLNVQPAA